MTRLERDTKATEIRASIRSEMNEKRRGWVKRVDGLQWELDHLTTADTINDRRAEMGLAAWANALEG